VENARDSPAHMLQQCVLLFLGGFWYVSIYHILLCIYVIYCYHIGSYLQEYVYTCDVTNDNNNIIMCTAEELTGMTMTTTTLCNNIITILLSYAAQRSAHIIARYSAAMISVKTCDGR